MPLRGGAWFRRASLSGISPKSRNGFQDVASGSERIVGRSERDPNGLREDDHPSPNVRHGIVPELRRRLVVGGQRLQMPRAIFGLLHVSELLRTAVIALPWRAVRSHASCVDFASTGRPIPPPPSPRGRAFRVVFAIRP